MNPQRPIEADFGRHALRTLDWMGSLVAHLSFESEPGRVAALELKIVAGRSFVLGNRPDSYAPTVGDFKLLVVSDLRVLLEELEKSE